MPFSSGESEDDHVNGSKRLDRTSFHIDACEQVIVYSFSRLVMVFSLSPTTIQSLQNRYTVNCFFFFVFSLPLISIYTNFGLFPLVVNYCRKIKFARNRGFALPPSPLPHLQWRVYKQCVTSYCATQLIFFNH